MVQQGFGALYGAASEAVPKPLREFVKFSVVGGVGFIVDFATYGFLTRILGWDAVFCVGFDGWRQTLDLASIRECGPHYPIVAANMVSVLFAITSNFFLNKFWTFRDPRGGVIATQGAAYLAMSIVTWSLNQVLTGLFASRIDILHVLFGDTVDLAAKILAVAVVWFVNFTGSKFLIFRKKSAPPLPLTPRPRL